MTIYQEQLGKVDERLKKFALDGFSKDELHKLFDQSLTAIAFVRGDGSIQWCNQAWETHKGLITTEQTNQNICHKLVDLGGKSITENGRLREDIFPAKGTTTKYLRSNVRNQKYSFLTRSIATGSDGPPLWVVQAQDLSKLVKLSAASFLFQGLFGSSSEAILVTNSKGIITRANNGIKKITGHEPKELIKTNISDLESKKRSSNFYGRIAEELSSQDYWEGTVRFQRIDGSSIAERVCVVRIGKIGANTQYISIIRNTPKAEALSSMEPELTPLMNLGFPKKNELMLDIDSRLNTGNSFSLFYVMFKQDEQTLLKPQIGSQPVLVQMLTNLRKSIPDNCSISAISGREFVVLSEMLDQATLNQRARRIKSVVSSKRYLTGDIKLHLSPQIGVVLSGNVYRNSADYLNAAKDAATDAHQANIKEINIIDPAAARHKKSMESLSIKLRKALRNNEVYPAYEPFFDLDKNKVIGCEALVRWNSPEMGELSPGQFLPVAMEHGLMEELTELMFYRTCVDVSGWLKKGLLLDTLSLNIPARDVDSDYLPRLIDKTLVATGLEEKYLQIEITEEGLVNKDKSVEVLSKIRERGIRIAIDDFGTGYSCLSYLKDLPVDALKIDRSFVSGVTRNAGDMGIVETINFLGQKLGLKTIAEGIESIDQKEALQRMGCNLGQGFLFSKSKKAEQFKKLLEHS